MATTAYSLQNLIEDWSPPGEPHCSNCRHCVVFGDPQNPSVICNAGHGKVRDLWVLIRQKQARGWKNAAECTDFESMSDERETA